MSPGPAVSEQEMALLLHFAPLVPLVIGWLVARESLTHASTPPRELIGFTAGILLMLAGAAWAVVNALTAEGVL